MNGSSHQEQPESDGPEDPAKHSPEAIRESVEESKRGADPQVLHKKKKDPPWWTRANICIVIAAVCGLAVLIYLLFIGTIKKDSPNIFTPQDLNLKDTIQFAQDCDSLFQNENLNEEWKTLEDACLNEKGKFITLFAETKIFREAKNPLTLSVTTKPPYRLRAKCFISNKEQTILLQVRVDDKGQILFPGCREGHKIILVVAIIAPKAKSLPFTQASLPSFLNLELINP